MTLWDDISVPASVSVWRALNATDQHRILVGRNELGQPLLMLELQEDYEDVVQRLPEMTGITIDYQLFSESERSGVVLTLKAAAEIELFEILCNDLAHSLRGSSTERSALLAFLARLKRWQQLLALGGARRLTAEEVRGIVAELVVFEILVDRGRSAAHVLECWVGPSGSAQDFVFPDQAIEVKASSNGRRVRISSEHQLEVNDKSLILFVVHLIAATSASAVSLNGIVERIIARIGNLKPKFEDVLASAGYIARPEYDAPTFRVAAASEFAVLPGFPALTRFNLPGPITNVEYDLEVADLASFQIQQPE